MQLEKCLTPFCVFLTELRTSVFATRFYFCNDPQCDSTFARSGWGDPGFKEKNAPSSPQCANRQPLYLPLALRRLGQSQAS